MARYVIDAPTLLYLIAEDVTPELRVRPSRRRSDDARIGRQASARSAMSAMMDASSKSFGV